MKKKMLTNDTKKTALPPKREKQKPLQQWVNRPWVTVTQLPWVTESWLFHFKRLYVILILCLQLICVSLAVIQKLFGIC